MVGATLPKVVIHGIASMEQGVRKVVDRLTRAALLAALLPALTAVPAEARRGPGDDGWRPGWPSVRLCRSESCWAKHPDGWGAAPRERHGRR